MKATYTITGMHCPSCSKLLSMELDDLDGVEAYALDEKTGSLSIDYNEQILSYEALQQAIRETGPYDLQK